MRVWFSSGVESRQLWCSLYHYCLISAEAAVCGHKQHAEPSTTGAQRLQGPRTRDGPKTEENENLNKAEPEEINLHRLVSPSHE